MRTKKRFVTFEPFDLVLFRFPFVERATMIRRPALILSSHSEFGAESGVALVAMVTSARHSRWPFDVQITDIDIAGLKQPCIVRMKLGSASLGEVERRIGTLGDPDRNRVKHALRGVLAAAI
jgi:mRNA interferase MazF